MRSTNRRTKAAAAQFLCPTEADRRRAVDTSARVRRARGQFVAVLGIGMLALAPILSWWLAALFGVQAAYLATLDRRMKRAEYPELVAAGAVATTGISLAIGASITGGPESPMLPLLAAPVSFIAARFRPKVVLVGVITAILTVIGIGLALDPAGMIDQPSLSIIAIVLIAGVGAVTAAIEGAEVQQRRESVLDPLTGLLNRKALESRFDEIEQQAGLTGEHVCLIELDLDHFKRVNDTLGHARGDAVLREAAYQLRKTARSFELIYRIGGEEFLVLAPGADLEHGMDIAERLRLAVADSRPDGVDITISLGVATASGKDASFDRLFADADEALYAAKRAGRNRVVAAGEAASEPRPLGA